MEELDAEQRAGHACTHNREGAGDDQRNVGTIWQQSGARSKRTRGSQPNAGVIQQEIKTLDSKFDAYTVALATVSSLSKEDSDRLQYEEDLVNWTDYYGSIKDRALAVVSILTAPVQNAPADTEEVFTFGVPSHGGQGGSQTNAVVA